MKNYEFCLIAVFLLCSYALLAQTPSIDPSKRCLYTQAEFSDQIYFFGNDPRVEQIVDEIIRATGIAKNFKVAAANIPSVAAVKDRSGNYLLYSLSYTRQLLPSNPDLLYTILAHEIGHFAREHKLDGKFRVTEESSADEFMGRALFQLRNFGSLYKVLQINRRAPFAYNYLYQNGMRDKIISNGWNTSDGIVKSNGNLGYLDNENNVEKLPLPLFTVKGCPRVHPFPIQGFTNCKTIKDIDQLLVRMLNTLGYEQKSYYYAPNGFAMLTSLEQIDRSGKPLLGVERWQDYPSVTGFDGIFDYLSSLVLPKKGYFRLFVFLVSDQNVDSQNGKLNAGDAKAWLREGGFWLPASIGDKLLTDNHRFSILIYEFEAPETTKKMKECCESLFTIKDHLNTSGIGNALK
ncbi:MAG: hypothetical protein DHS20C18_10760 [Saprospiraceae bacterium]|nr:MAG: hypothetical protein DHS20C18_10760 [Saprospiraceae bacterium]